MRVSFDFDGTLSDHFDGALNPSREAVVSELKRLVSLEHDVFIVTKRYSPEKSRHGLVNEHIEPLSLAAYLGIPRDRVVFTDRALKADKLHSMGVGLHFDDCEYELEYFLRRYPDSKMGFALVSSDPWRLITQKSNDPYLHGAIQ